MRSSLFQLTAIDVRGRIFATANERMAFAIELSRENVERGTGGPFGAAIFERDSHRLVAVGMNSVVRLGNRTLHAEMVAFQMATRRIGAFTLAGAGIPAHELVSSCDPCAMCLDAILWSGPGVLSGPRPHLQRLRLPS